MQKILSLHWTVVLPCFTDDKVAHVDYKYKCLFHLMLGQYKLVSGASCPSSYIPLTTSWEKCRDAAVLLGFTGDSVAHVDFKYNFGKSRPQGCFRSDGNGRFHFNRAAGGSFMGNDQILCESDKRGNISFSTICVLPYFLFLVLPGVQ